MALTFTGNNLIRSLKPGIISCVFSPPNSVRNYAARRSTRLKKEKAKQKIVIEKVAWSPERSLLKKQSHLLKTIKRTTETKQLEPIDNVYFTSKYITRAMSISEAVQYHRENFHPTMLDVPEAPVEVTLELDLKDGKNSTVKNFKLLANIPNPWITKTTKQMIVFCKTPEMKQIAEEKGADVAGGAELIEKIQKGQFSLSGFDHILCHESIYLELSVIRGLMKTKYPMKRDGTLGSDLAAMVHKFRHGLEISCVANQFQPDLAFIKIPIGSVKLTDSQVEENFESILQTVMKKAPVKSDPFVTWVWCTSPFSHEQFKIDHESYVSRIELPVKKGKKKANA